MAKQGRKLMNEDVLWDVPPPEDRRPYVPILSAKVGGSQEALIVNEKMVGVFTHYYAMRTRPCLGKDKGCEGCEHDQSRRWKGYLGGWLPTVSRYVLVEVTEQAAADNKAVLLDPERSLRGMVARLSRTGRAKNAPVKLQLLKSALKEAEWPQPFDVKAALLRVWERRPEDVRAEREAEVLDHVVPLDTPEAG